MRSILVVILSIFMQVSDGSENIETVETFLSVETSKSLGHELRIVVNDAMNSVKSGQLNVAMSKVDEAIKSFHKLFDNSKKQLTFQTDLDYYEYVKINGTGFQRIDWGYREALHIKSYIYSGTKRFDEALKVINELGNVAPVSVGSMVEKGYILSQLKKIDKSFEIYQQASKLADIYSSQAVFKPAALRGMGFVLIEKNELDRAESLFKQSLELEPGNSTALNELEYIKDLRNR